MNCMIRVIGTLFLCVSLGCSPRLPSVDDVRVELQRRLATEANDCMKMISTEKTNGYESPTLANTYVVQFAAEVEMLKDCKWRSSSTFRQTTFESFKTTITEKQARQTGGILSEFANTNLEPGSSYTAGTRVAVEGEQAFMKTEQGYVPTSDSLSMKETRRLISDEEAQRVTIALLFSLESATANLFKADFKPLEHYLSGTPDGDIRGFLVGLLVPRHMAALPERDGWGHVIEYVKSGQRLFVRSPGRDGKFSFEQSAAVPESEFYPPEYYPDASYDNDVVFLIAGGMTYPIWAPECSSHPAYSDSSCLPR